MVINTNLSAQSSARILSESSKALDRSLARLSSGTKLVSPDDDAAGLAVSARFNAQVSRLGAVSNNLSNAISFTQTQDGYLQKVGKALDRMGELAVLAQDVTKTDADRGLYNLEYAKLKNYVIDTSAKEFNGVPLFGTTDLHVTTDSDANAVQIDAIDLGAQAYLNAEAASIDTGANAANALTAVKSAITQLAEDRANLGANMSILNSYNGLTGVLKETLSTADSRLRDVDVAYESTNFARANILVQSGVAMLAQANQSAQGVLKLLG